MTLPTSGIIENYIQRVTEFSQSAQRLPTAAELEKIATDLGIDPEEIQAAQREAQAHYTRAQGYLRLRHWEDAITELQDAVALNPANSEMLLALAQAHLGRWRLSHRREDAEELRLRARQCLALDPNSDPALELLGLFSKLRQRRRQGFWALVLFVGAVLTGGLGYLLIQGRLPYVLQSRAELEQLERRLEGETRRLREDQSRLQEEILARQRAEDAALNLRLIQLQNRLQSLEKELETLKKPEPSPSPAPPQG
ncbi:MAG: tetratricopeptide repeat protein [Cyanobacteriota bacterium]|jgi:tetratricopeptide (TPR) repeat protein